MKDKVLIIKDVEIKDIEEIHNEQYMDTSYFMGTPPFDPAIHSFPPIMRRQEQIPISKIFIDGKEMRFGITEQAKEKFPILHILNIVLEEKEYLEKKLIRKDIDIYNLSNKLHDYNNSKIIKFFHFIKIL